MTFRTAKKLVDAKWVDVEFENLRSGDRFRLFEGGTTVAEATAVDRPVPLGQDGNYVLNVDGAIYPPVLA